MAPVTRAKGKQGPLLDEDGGSTLPASRSVAPILRRSLQARDRRLRLRPPAPCGGRFALGTSSDLMAFSTRASNRAHKELILKAEEYRATIATLTASLAAEKAARIKAEKAAAAMPGLAYAKEKAASLAAEKAARIEAEEKLAAAMETLVYMKEKMGMITEMVHRRCRQRPGQTLGLRRRLKKKKDSGLKKKA